MEETSAEVTYPLAQGSAETRRMVEQSAFYNGYTGWVLDEAGIGPGMRVLDVGSGAGDVALLAATRVGRSGAVVGIDRDADGLAVARERAQAAGLVQATFREGDAAALDPGEAPFDAVVGRLVLMYQPDPAALLRRLARLLRPGGIVAFQEFDLGAGSLRTWPPVPLADRFLAWLTATFGRANVHMRMGPELYGAFRAAGLPAPRLFLAAPMGGGPDWGGYAQAEAVLRSLWPLMQRFGIATADEVDVDTFGRRLRDAVVAGGGVLKMPDLVSAWTRLP